MIFHKLALTNFGLFRGSHIFDLLPRVKYSNRRLIILFGGKNGSGKTTLLEAVRLCLYGFRSLEGKVSKGEYQEYLASRIHHSPDMLFKLNTAAVSLEFEHSHGGIRDKYTVERRWQLNEKGIEETLCISKNGDAINNELDPAHWQDFLNELIPPGLSQLFFFDGEKIQRLAEDSAAKGFLAESIKSLLGVDLVERLQSDLSIYLIKFLRKRNSPEAKGKLSLLQNNLERLEEELKGAEQNRKKTEDYLADVLSRIQRQEERIAAEGGGFARQRDTLKEKRVRLQIEIEQAENAIRNLCAGLLPFAFVPQLCRRLKERLEKETLFERWHGAEALLEEQTQTVINELRGEAFWQSLGEGALSQRAIQAIGDKVETLLKNLKPPESLRDFRPVHRLSSVDSQRLIGWIDRSLSDVPAQLRQETKKLDRCNSELQQTEMALQKIPSDEVLNPLMTQLTGLNRQLGELTKQARDEDERIRALSFKRDEVKRKIESVRKEMEEGEQLTQRASLVQKVQSVLSPFAQRLTVAKVEELKHTVANCFNQLCRKDNFVKRIEIDPLTFSVTLHDRRDQAIPKDELSAGEKQIYAISMLWGLAKTSAHPLPMIIDTPLGRLDSNHRQNLVERYFPYASHQVIILSTDTELERHYFEMLSPHISHAYHLEYNPLEGATVAEEGYFF